VRRASHDWAEGASQLSLYFLLFIICAHVAEAAEHNGGVGAAWGTAERQWHSVGGEGAPMTSRGAEVR
jgi:hypothetical protein